MAEDVRKGRDLKLKVRVTVPSRDEWLLRPDGASTGDKQDMDKKTVKSKTPTACGVHIVGE